MTADPYVRCYCGEPATTRLVGPDGSTVSSWCPSAWCRSEAYADVRVELGTATYCREVPA